MVLEFVHPTTEALESVCLAIICTINSFGSKQLREIRIELGDEINKWLSELKEMSSKSCMVQQ